MKLFKCAQAVTASHRHCLQDDSCYCIPQVFAPPVGHCLRCSSSLSSYNKPVDVSFVGLKGPAQAVKVSTIKCSRCKFYFWLAAIR